MASKTMYWIKYRYKGTGHVSVRPVKAYSYKQAYYYFFVTQMKRYGYVKYEYIRFVK